jgi:hypothetical protein
MNCEPGLLSFTATVTPVAMRDLMIIDHGRRVLESET